MPRNPMSYDDGTLVWGAAVEPIDLGEVRITTTLAPSDAEDDPTTDTIIIVPELLDGVIDALLAIRHARNWAETEKRQEAELAEFDEGRGDMPRPPAGSMPFWLR